MRMKSSCGERFQFDANREAALQFGNQVAGLRDVEGAGGHEQNVIGAHEAVTRVDGGAFDDGQDVALHAFAADVGAVAALAAGDLVDLVEEDDAAALDAFQGHARDLVHVDELLLFFLDRGSPWPRRRAFCACACAVPNMPGRTSLRLTSISSMPPAVVISKRGPRSLTSISTMRSSSLPARSFSRSFSRVLVDAFGALRLRRHQQVEQALFGVAFGAFGNLVQPLLADHVDGDVHQVANHRFDVAADVADLGELAGFDLEERRVGQPGQAARDFGFADAGGADHEDVLGHHLFGHLGLELLAADAVAQGDGDGALGVRLADDVLVEFADNLARRQFVEDGTLVRLAWQINDHAQPNSS